MYDILKLNSMKVAELKEVAEKMGITNAEKLKKQDLVFKIMDHQSVSSSSPAADTPTSPATPEVPAADNSAPDAGKKRERTRKPAFEKATPEEAAAPKPNLFADDHIVPELDFLAPSIRKDENKEIKPEKTENTSVTPAANATPPVTNERQERSDRFERNLRDRNERREFVPKNRDNQFRDNQNRDHQNRDNQPRDNQQRDQNQGDNQNLGNQPRQGHQNQGQQQQNNQNNIARPDRSKRGQPDEHGYNFDGVVIAEGVLEIMPDGFGFMRSSDFNYLNSPDDVYVSQQQIKSYGLLTGDTIRGAVRPPREGEKYFPLIRVDSINGRDPGWVRDRVPFKFLTPLFPYERFHLADNNNNISMRIMDLFSPIGKGQRGMIVSQPKTGKTTLLKDVANAIAMKKHI